MNGMKKRINVGIFIPVRLSSKRFPAKAIYDSSFGKPLEFLINNLSNNFINKKNIIICTSRDKIEKSYSDYQEILVVRFSKVQKMT